jgi:DNA primase
MTATAEPINGTPRAEEALSPFTLKKTAGSVDLIAYLEAEVIPRLTPDLVFTHESHRLRQVAPDKLQGGCPWHESKSGSAFYIHVPTLLWRCPACQVGGGPIQYLWRLRGGTGVSPRGQDFIETVRSLCELAKVSFPEVELSPRAQEVARKRETRRAILETVNALCTEVLSSEEGAAARAYLSERRFDADAARLLGLGLYPSVEKVKAALSVNGFHDQDIADSGAVFGRIVGYITFPWADERGAPLTICGTYPSRKPPDGTPKKMALPNPGKRYGDPWEATKRSPYCYDRARAAGHRDIVLVEGVTDAALAQARGDTRVVACVAAELSSEQVKTLARNKVVSVTIALDTDNAGANGIRSCVRQSHAASIAAYVAPQLPDGLDPDDFIHRDGIDAWRAHVAKAEHAYRHEAAVIVAAQGDGPLSDREKDAIVAEAEAYAKTQPTGRGEELVRHFLPEIIRATGADPEALRIRMGLSGVVPPAAEKAAEVLASLLEQARTDPPAAVATALLPENIATLAWLCGNRPGELETFFLGLKTAGARARDVDGLRQAVSRESRLLEQREKAKKQEEERQRREQARTADERAVFSNFTEAEEVDEGGKLRVVRSGLPIQPLAGRAAEITGGWPRRVGSLLFGEDAGPRPVYLSSPADVLAYVSRFLPQSGKNPLRWAQGPDMVSESRFCAYLAQTAPDYDAVEAYPHWPRLARHFYMHPPLEGDDGWAMRTLLERFSPASAVDHDLIEAFLCTLFWGGEPGLRPAFLFTGRADDPHAGRGIGESRVPLLLSRLVGGYVSVDQQDRMGDIVTRLLSLEALVQRVLLLDDVKALKFSLGQLEAMVTSPSISGHRMYHGEGKRPNTLTTAITLRVCPIRGLKQFYDNETLDCPLSGRGG